MKKFDMKKHVHKRCSTCICKINGIEPDEQCPVHGSGEFPLRCEICGKFMKRKLNYVK